MVIAAKLASSMRSACRTTTTARRGGVRITRRRRRFKIIRIRREKGIIIMASVPNSPTVFMCNNCRDFRHMRSEIQVSAVKQMIALVLRTIENGNPQSWETASSILQDIRESLRTMDEDWYYYTCVHGTPYMFSACCIRPSHESSVGSGGPVSSSRGAPAPAPAPAPPRTNPAPANVVCAAR